MLLFGSLLADGKNAEASMARLRDYASGIQIEVPRYPPTPKRELGRSESLAEDWAVSRREFLAQS